MIALDGSITTTYQPSHPHGNRRRLRQLSDEDLLNALHIAEGDYGEAAKIAVGLLSGRRFKKELRRRGLQGEVRDVQKRAKTLRNARKRLETVKTGADT